MERRVARARLALAGLRWRLGFVDELVPDESADDDEPDDDER
jgi:hypothetical protein